MTLTIALIINSVHMAGIVVLLATVMRIPFRLDRTRVSAGAVPDADGEGRRELSRAA
jgi:hypothetical protein